MLIPGLMVAPLQECKILRNTKKESESRNKDSWIMGLMECYKKEPGGREKLKERNPNLDVPTINEENDIQRSF